MRPDTKVIFREVQRFRHPLLWLLIIVTCLVDIGIFGPLMVQQLILGKPAGNNPMSDAMLIITGTGSFLLCLGIIWLFYSAQLISEVRHDGLYIKFFPLHLSYRQIGWEQLKNYQARTYNPIREYGGWGIRWSWSKGKAYNVSGNQGVQLELANGKRLLIGSQRPEELVRAIDSVLKRIK